MNIYKKYRRNFGKVLHYTDFDGFLPVFERKMLVKSLPQHIICCIYRDIFSKKRRQCIWQPCGIRSKNTDIVFYRGYKMQNCAT